MDYKYIEQLMERYWEGETTLQEESILRNFFSQDGLPEELQQYQPLFDTRLGGEQALGDDFDERIIRMIGDEQQPEVSSSSQARLISISSRLKPLFKAAAIVAIILTLGNAAQAPWNYGWDNPKDEYARFHQQQAADSAALLNPVQAENIGDSALLPKPEATHYIE